MILVQPICTFGEVQGDITVAQDSTAESEIAFVIDSAYVAVSAAYVAEMSVDPPFFSINASGPKLIISVSP